MSAPTNTLSLRAERSNLMIEGMVQCQGIATGPAALRNDMLHMSKLY
jgi:hypothetical protein